VHVLAVVLWAAVAEGRPLFYWGARQPLIATDAGSPEGVEAKVAEVHAARDAGTLVLRFSFDRPVREALQLSDGTPVSGRLHAILYLDTDDDRGTGLQQGPRDLRSGAEHRLELGVESIGADAEEKRAARALVSVSLYALGADGRRRAVWRADAAGAPRSVSAHGEWVELRIPEAVLALGPHPRLILAAGDQVWDGRLAP
jgi:hypothetical protein